MEQYSRYAGVDVCKDTIVVAVTETLEHEVADEIR